MFEPDAILAAIMIAAGLLTSATIVLSRIVPDEYDRRVPARTRVDPRRPRK
jgi:hypothetical protein